VATTTHQGHASTSLARICALLPVERNTLFVQTMSTIHQQYGSASTFLLELNRTHCTGQVLAFAGFDPSGETICHDLNTILLEQINTPKHNYFIEPSAVAEKYPDDVFFHRHPVVSYLSTPITSASGEILGMVISVFNKPITIHNEAIHFQQILSLLISHELRIQRLKERSDMLLEQLNYEVSHDNLTNLMNRSVLSDTLERLISTTTTAFTLVTLNIDSFKSINDIYGTYIGDQVLKTVSQAIIAISENKDLIFRIGGDEFAFITFYSNPISQCEKLLNQLSGGYQDLTNQIRIKVHMGIASRGSEALTADQLLFHASLALKDGKQHSHQYINSYDTRLHQQYHRRTQIINALRDELTEESTLKQNLFVVMQPIVERNQDQWDYFEILSRWLHPEIGFISPVEFVSAAEQSGLVFEFGQRIILLACQAKHAVEQQLGYKIRLSINCSADELMQADNYVSSVITILDTFGFHAEEFTIELTETALLTQREIAQNILAKLRAIGFKIALDDFGTGYSSLNYIQSYPIDCIKIDASFIRNMMTNKTSERLVSLIVQLAKQLKVQLVAEGIEDIVTLEKLYAMECTKIQGYYFSKPIPPELIIERLRQNGPSIN
jgi:diguanylate cyclase (GGDEF)-like protein